MSRAHRPGSIAALGVAGVWSAGFLAPDLHLALLYLAPALLLAMALAAGRYPGAVVLDGIAARRRGPDRRPVAPVRLGRRPRTAGPRAGTRGGLLLGRRLAGRAPPRLLEA